MVRWPRESAAELQRELSALADHAPGRWGFAVREAGASVASVNGDATMPTASTIKVAVMILALQDVAAGKRRLDEVLDVPQQRVGGSGVLQVLSSIERLRLDEALELMIGISDNTATNMVIAALGLEDAAQRIRELGAHATRLGRYLMDTAAARSGQRNVTTADDQALLLDKLAGDDLLPDAERRLALDMLGRQHFNDRIPAALGPDVRCLHKTGEITGVRHDVGLLEFDGRLVAFAALGSDLTDPASQAVGTGPAGEIIATAARAVVEAARSVAPSW